MYKKIIIKILFIFVFNTNLYAETLAHESVNTIISQFKSKKKHSEQWNKYLIQNHSISDTNYIKVLNQINNKYIEAVKRYQTCCIDYSAKESSYSDKWLEDLKNKFNNKEIVENKVIIKKIIGWIAYLELSNSCLKNEEEILSIELCLRTSLKNYIYFFKEFLSKNKIRDEYYIQKIITAEKMISTFDSCLYSEIYKKKLFNITRTELLIKETEKEYPKITLFFINHSFFSKPFNFFKVLDDLESIKL